MAFEEVASVATIAVASVAVVSFFLFQDWRLVGALGMPLDDAWIHFRIAENLATGHGFSFNPDVPTAASTSPVWTILLAAAYLVTHRFLVSAVVLGSIFYLVANVGVYYLVLQIKADRRLALAAALFSVATGRWVWASLSGMETTLFAATTLWGILLFGRYGSAYRWKSLCGLGLLGLSVLIRPEGSLALVIAAVLQLLRQQAMLVGVSLRSLPRQLARSGAVAPLATLGIALALRIGYTLSTGGGFVGNTFLAQSLPQGDNPYTGPRWLPDLWYLRGVAQSLRADDFLLGMLIPLGLVQAIRLAIRDQQHRVPTLLALMWFVGLPLLNSVVAPNLRHHERYLMPLIPLAVIFGTLGIDLLVDETLGDRLRLKIPLLKRFLVMGNLFVLVAAICLVDAMADAKRWSVQYATDVQAIESVNVRVGEWIRDNTPANAYVAMNDIGAIAFVSKRRVLDTVGIAEPDILPYLARDGREGALEYLEQRRPDYLVIWPEWYPEVKERADIFKPIFSLKVNVPGEITRPSMLGGREMVVYEAHWPRR